MSGSSHLLLSLPQLIIHPPSHPSHTASLYTALLALRKCTALHVASDQNYNAYGDALSTEMACQAWTMLAEVGMLILAAGLTKDDGPVWAHDIEQEVEIAISKGLQVSSSSRQASIRSFAAHLTLLHSSLAAWQGNIKFSRAILKRVNITTMESPRDQYSVLLTLHANFLVSSSSHTFPVDIQSALQVTAHLLSLASHNRHPTVEKLALAMRLRTLVVAEMWHARQGESKDMSIAGCLAEIEARLDLEFPDEDLTTEVSNEDTVNQLKSTSVALLNMQLHVIVVAILYYTLVADNKASTSRLKRLHAVHDMMAIGAENGDESSSSFSNLSAYFSIPLEPDPPLIVKMTHPQVMYDLAFLVSAVSKRDPNGRTPRRKVYASEGLAIASSHENDEFVFPQWAGLADVREVEKSSAEIQADLLCELAAVCIARSEFEEAQDHLASLIAHTRTYSIFLTYAARISLHQAHLAHATHHFDRALDCYRAAAFLDEQADSAAGPSSRSGVPWGGSGTVGHVRTAARAGEVGLRLGLQALRQSQSSAMVSLKGKEKAWDYEEDVRELDEMAKQVVLECRAFTGSLAATGLIIEAVITDEISKSKQCLKAASAIASSSRDQYLSALTLALTSSHYFHTASEHAKKMLDTVRGLAAGLGAASDKTKEAGRRASSDIAPVVFYGNAPLGLWVGERFQDLYDRSGKAHKAEEQAKINEVMRQAVIALPTRYRVDARMKNDRAR